MFDGIAVFKAFTDAAGWKFSQAFLRPMTDVEKQKHDANSPAALQQKQAQSQQQMQAQKFQQDQVMEDQKQLGKAGGEVLRQSIQHSLDMENTGEPGTSPQGFGTETNL